LGEGVVQVTDHKCLAAEFFL